MASSAESVTSKPAVPETQKIADLRKDVHDPDGVPQDRTFTTDHGGEVANNAAMPRMTAVENSCIHWQIQLSKASASHACFERLCICCYTLL